MTRPLVWLGVCCVVLLGAVGGNSALAAEATAAVEEVQVTTPAAAGEEWRSRKIFLDLKAAPLVDALRLLFKNSPYSYVLSPEIGRLALDPLTIRLKEVELQAALRVICAAYDLLYEKEDSIYYFFPRADVVTIGGRRVPLLGALQVPGMAPDLETARSIITKLSLSGPDPGGIQTRLFLSQLPYFDVLVDLEVENAPLSEVAKKLSVQREGADRTEIIVHESVPSDVRVTARIYRMRRDEILQMVADQGNLDVSVEPAVQEEEDGPITPNRVYLMRKPELHVTGSGVIGGRGGGGAGGRPYEQRISGGGGGGRGGSAD